IWSELGAALPGSGGSYVYLLECFGREKWGRPMAFLFIWQFLISGPLELASGLGAIALFSKSLTPEIQEFNQNHAIEYSAKLNEELTLQVGTGPSYIFALALGVLIIFLLYRRITSLGKLPVTFWLGVLAIIAWILFEGFTRGQPMEAFALFGEQPGLPRI